MTTSCPVNSYTCNTHAPIWLTSKNISSGSIYPVNGETVTRSYCASWNSNCCSWNGTIKIKDCSNYYVYYLTRPPVCHLAYCFGEKVPYNLNLSHTASTEDQNGCMGFHDEEQVEIVGTPKSMDLLNQYMAQFQGGMLDESVLNETTPYYEAVPIEDANQTYDNSGAMQTVVDVHLTKDGFKPDAVKPVKEISPKFIKERKPKIKTEDLNRLQYEVLQEHKRKLVAQTLYYELMNKKLRREMENES